MKKLSLPLKVFLIILAVFVLFFLVASILRVTIGHLTLVRAIIRFVLFGLIGGSIVGGIGAGITAVVVAARKLGK